MRRITASARAAPRNFTWDGAYRRRLLAISALCLSLYVAIVPSSTTASLGQWNTDHCAHVGAAILFWHHGFAENRVPVRELCAAPSPASRAFAARLGLPPDDVCDLPERAGERPLFINWQDQPRPYPPGALLFALPEALLYAHTGLSVHTISRISIIKDLLVGHVLVYALLALLFGGPDDDARPRWRSVAVVIAPLVYFAVVPLAMTGFYDPIAILCVCLAIPRLYRDEPAQAIGFLALAAFLQFRAIWYVPLGIVALLQLRKRPEVVRERRAAATLGAAAALLGLSALALVLVAPYLNQFPHTNPAQLAHLPELGPAQINFLLIVAVAVGCLAWQREWLLLALIGWQIAVLVVTVQAQGWHSMFLLPNLVVARYQRARPASIAVIVLLVVGFSRVLYLETALPGAFGFELLRGNL